MMNSKTYTSIDHYLEDFPSDIVVKLRKIREVIAQNAPEAVECIAYMLCHPAMLPFKKNYQNIKWAKAPYNFLWSTKFPMILLLRS